jgi:hypothetical protein
LCSVYGDNVMSDSCVREWCRKCRNGRTNVHDRGGQGWHSIVTDELVQKVDQCVRGKRRFMISDYFWRISTNFEDYFILNCHGQIGLPQVLCTVGTKKMTDSQNTKNRVSLDVSSALPGRGTNFLTQSWLVTRVAYSSWMQRPRAV